eukprot:UN01635
MAILFSHLVFNCIEDQLILSKDIRHGHLLIFDFETCLGLIGHIILFLNANSQIFIFANFGLMVQRQYQIIELFSSLITNLNIGFNYKLNTTSSISMYARLPLSLASIPAVSSVCFILVQAFIGLFYGFK